MIITKFETWWVERGRCLFDEKRQGGAKMGWDVIAIKLTTDTGIEGVATCMAARSGAVSEATYRRASALLFWDVTPMTVRPSSRNCGPSTVMRHSFPCSCPAPWM